MAATKRAMSHVALLRGINVGGNNVIPMRALAATFEALGLLNVTTYIQSGNVLFASRASDARRLEKRIEAAVKDAHRCEVKVVVRSREQMLTLARTLPRSWKKPDPAKRYNVMFLRHTIDAEDVLDGIAPKPGIEEVTYRPGALLWSANIRDLTRTAMLKVVSMPIYEHITVRNLNTTMKLCALLAADGVSAPASRSRRPSGRDRGS